MPLSHGTEGPLWELPLLGPHLRACITSRFLRWLVPIMFVAETCPHLYEQFRKPHGGYSVNDESLLVVTGLSTAPQVCSR